MKILGWNCDQFCFHQFDQRLSTKFSINLLATFLDQIRGKIIGSYFEPNFHGKYSGIFGQINLPIIDIICLPIAGPNNHLMFLDQLFGWVLGQIWERHLNKMFDGQLKLYSGPRNWQNIGLFWAEFRYKGLDRDKLKRNCSSSMALLN